MLLGHIIDDLTYKQNEQQNQEYFQEESKEAYKDISTK